MPRRRRRRVRGGAGDHVRHQPGAHRRVVRRPGPRVRELGHHRRHLRRGRGRHHEAGTGQDAHAGAGRGGRRRAGRDAVPQHGRRGRDELPDRCRGRRQGAAHRTRADGERSVGAVDRADRREPALGGSHDQGRPRPGPTHQCPHAPRRRAGGTSDRRAQRVQRVPVPPPTPRRHDRHAQGAARAVRHVRPVRGGARGDRPRAGGSRASDLGHAVLAADGHPGGAERRHRRALRLGARRGARLRPRPPRRATGADRRERARPHAVDRSGPGDAGVGAAATDDRRAQGAVRRSHDERRGAPAALPGPAPGRRGDARRRTGAADVPLRGRRDPRVAHQRPAAPGSRAASPHIETEASAVTLRR